MTGPSEPQIPELFVLWHPRCQLGQIIASRIYEWIRPDHGLGPDVFYRCLPAPGAPAGGLPLPLPGDLPSPGARNQMPANRPQVNLQIVIVLLDENMVADYAWRHWLEALSQSQPTDTRLRRTMFPVALDSTAFNAPSPLNQRNYLRPVGLPLADPPGPDCAKAQELAIRSLLKQLTEALCKLLLTALPDNVATESEPAGSNHKIAIFLSHAKADGTAPARRIRDFIYANTQLAAFYDENDIPFGSAFSRVLDDSITSNSTAALIAVQTQKYATRPWCRRELSIFRRPRVETQPDAGDEQWKLHPIVVVNALEPGAHTASIPEIGNSTQIRWSGDPIDLEEEIVTTVLRDALLAEFHAALGRSLRANGRIVINWLPDPTTLLHIPQLRNTETAVEVLYPGRGLAGLELDILDELFPAASFYSFDSVDPEAPRVRGAPLQPWTSDANTAGHKYRSLSNPESLIAISISHEPEPILTRGLGIEHLRELLMRVARPIRRSGADLAFAGSWQETPDNFTYDLLRLISAEQEDNSLRKSDKPGTSPKIGRLRNHLAWPYYLRVTPGIEAQWIQCCRIIRYTQEMAGIVASQIAPDDEPETSDRYLFNGDIVLSQMRRAVVRGMTVPIQDAPEPYTVPKLTARILLGGKARGFKGFLPGLFEEALLTLKARRPLYILGGFGGTGEILAKALAGQDPPELTIDWQEAATPAVRLVLKGLKQSEQFVLLPV